jgi:splicing factor 1
MQLRELALLNGTLRETDGVRCSNCGSTVHRSWQCPDKPNVTNNVICTNCNGVGHIARDCKEKKTITGTVNQSKIDEEYMSLMAELGEGLPLPPKTTTTNSNSNSHSGGLGPTISMTSSVPKAIAPPPPPLSQATNTAHTPLLPTPNIPQQNNSWNSGPTAQTCWPSTQTPFGVHNTNANAYPINDSYAPNNIYSSTNSPMPWNSTGITVYKRKH